MKIYSHQQGSDAWLQCRVGKITASRYKDARDRLKPAKGETIGKPSAKCIAYAAQVAVERIAQRPIDKVYENWQMREGKEQEPAARNAYDVETGHVVQEVGAIATDDDLFLYSPDGLIGDDGLLEIKTLCSADVICKVVGEGDLSPYMDQCLGGLWLTGRQWIDLVLWAPALEPIGRALTIHRITRDEAQIEALESDLIAFAQMVQDAEAKLRGNSGEAEERGQLAAAEAAQRQEVVARTEPQREPSPAPAAGPAVIPMPTRAPAAPAGPPTLRLGQINERLGFTVSADFLASLGYPLAGTDKAAKLWHESSWKGICAAIAQHVVAVANAQKAA